MVPTASTVTLVAATWSAQLLLVENFIHDRQQRLVRKQGTPWRQHVRAGNTPYP